MLLSATRWSHRLTDGANNTCQALMTISVTSYWHLFSPKPYELVVGPGYKHCIVWMSLVSSPGGRKRLGGTLGCDGWLVSGVVTHQKGFLKKRLCFSSKSHTCWGDTGIYLFYLQYFDDDLSEKYMIVFLLCLCFVSVRIVLTHQKKELFLLIRP